MLNRIYPRLLPIFATAAILLVATACSKQDEGWPCETDTECGANAACADASCVCDAGYNDCDDNPANGCEFEGACPCTPNETRSCYDGVEGTKGVGPCQAGEQTCNTDGSWTECTGQVVPRVEGCDADGIDTDCNGTVDDLPDEDGDGYSACNGDCCDSIEAHCAADPSLVNPGAYDFPDNEIDDDCDDVIDNPPVQDCGVAMTLQSTSASDLAKAMDICHTVATDGSGWGLVGAELTTVDGTQDPNPMQRAVLPALGTVVGAQTPASMAVLSSGRARGVGDPGFVPGDYDFMANGDIESFDPGTGSLAPMEYLSQHQNTLQSVPQCPAGESMVFDSVRLRLYLKAPSNAQGFSFQFRFFSYEYPVYLCTGFNDFFLALVDSQHPDIPADRNISFDANGAPVSVNNAFFTSCEPLACNQGSGEGDGSMAPMAGDDSGPPMPVGEDNDFDGCPDSLRCDTATNLCVSDYGACPDTSAAIAGYNTRLDVGGGTGWLTTSAPVVPGETITLDFHIWDTSDASLDSLVLLDNFQWLVEPTAVVTKQ